LQIVQCWKRHIRKICRNYYLMERFRTHCLKSLHNRCYIIYKDYADYFWGILGVFDSIVFNIGHCHHSNCL
jgi:hypothetical protein